MPCRQTALSVDRDRDLVVAAFDGSVDGGDNELHRGLEPRPLRVTADDDCDSPVGQILLTAQVLSEARVPSARKPTRSATLMKTAESKARARSARPSTAFLRITPALSADVPIALTIRPAISGSPDPRSSSQCD
jgi:hypothetical protein